RPKENSFRGAISTPDFLDWRRMAKSFSKIALYDTAQFNFSYGSGDPERLPGARVTGGFLSALGVQPYLGSDFDANAEQPGHHRVVVIPHGLWQRRFGGDRAILGKSAIVNGEPFAIVGVLPRNFRFPFASECELLVPTVFTEAQLRWRG